MATLNDKLKKILDSVAGTEADLKRQCRKQEERLQELQDTLSKAVEVKKALIEFDPDKDGEKKQNINGMLDMLETSLKNLVANEPQYRSRELNTEVEEYKKQLKKCETNLKANASEITALRMELEKWNGKEMKWEEEKKQMKERWNEELHHHLKQCEDRCKHGFTEQIAKFKHEIDSANKQLESIKQEKQEKEKEVEQLRKLDEAHQQLRIRWQDQQKSSEDELEQRSAEVTFLKKILAEKEQTIQTLQEKSINREMQSEQIQSENAKLITQLNTLQELPEKMDKIMKEKLVLIREIKTLRAQKEETNQQFEEERSKLKLTHLSEMESLGKQMSAEMEIKNGEVKRMEMELKRKTELFEKENQTNSKYFEDVLCKLESFNMALDNCAIEKLQQTTPGMSELERREKSNDILKLLLETISEALQSDHLDQTNTDESKNDSSLNHTSHSESCNPHIRKLYRTVMELLCDKAASIKKENDSVIQINQEKNKKKTGKKT